MRIEEQTKHKLELQAYTTNHLTDTTAELIQGNEIKKEYYDNQAAIKADVQRLIRVMKTSLINPMMASPKGKSQFNNAVTKVETLISERQRIGEG